MSELPASPAAPPAGDKAATSQQEVRNVLLVVHPGRPDAVREAAEAVKSLRENGCRPWTLGDHNAPVMDDVTPWDNPDISGLDLVLVLGGDGTILRAAELVRGTDVPLLGVNLGKVGFLAESEKDDLTTVVQRIAQGEFQLEKRMTLDVQVHLEGHVVHRDWALNEAALEKGNRQRLVDVVCEVDGQPLTSFGCDGLVMATPTGSTAYAFSAGGPIISPEVEAIMMIPISAHALFARPFIVGTTSTFSAHVTSAYDSAVLWCDGRRSFDVPSGARVHVQRGEHAVTLVRLHTRTFVERLVAKFHLPTAGFRDRKRPEGD